MSVEPELIDVAISDLKPGMKHLNLIVKVLQIGETREVISRHNGTSHKLAEVVVGDETGTIIIPVWDDLIEKFEVGSHLKIINSYTNLFEQRLRLSIGRFGRIEETTGNLYSILFENNMSLEIHPDEEDITIQ